MYQIVADDMIDVGEFKARPVLDNLHRSRAPVECADDQIQRYPTAGKPVQAVPVLRQSNCVNRFFERPIVFNAPPGASRLGSRVPIDRVVWEYWNGEEPETIQAHYPTLTLEQVNGAISFYLNHKDEVDQVIAECRRAEDAWVAANPTPPDIIGKFERMRRQMLARRG